MSSAARRLVGAIAVLAMVCTTARVFAAPDATGEDPLAAYLADPYRNRGDLIAFARGHRDALSFPVLLALADANVRGGRLREARAILNDVLARRPPPDIAEWAGHGLGWIALASGDFAEAHVQYDRIANRTTDPAVGVFALALMAGMNGQVADAVALLDEIAHAPETPAALRPASGLAAAYIQYWNGHDALAAARFGATATEFPTSPLADDARYGALRAGLRAGNEAESVAALAGLASETRGGRRAPPALVELEPRALFRHGLRAYRRAPVLAPAERMVALLDVDGATLARGALRTLGLDHPAGDPHIEARRVDAPRVDAPAAGVPHDLPAGAPAAARPLAARRPSNPTWRVMGLLLLLLAAAVAVWRRRQRANAQ